MVKLQREASLLLYLVLTLVCLYLTVEVSFPFALISNNSNSLAQDVFRFLERETSTKVREGFKKTYWGKVWSFAKPPPAPPPPPPGLVIFPTKKIDPHFFFRNKTLIGWNKFYTWSHLKIYSFFAFIMASIIAFFPPGFGAFGLLSKLS